MERGFLILIEGGGRRAVRKQDPRRLRFAHHRGAMERSAAMAFGGSNGNAMVEEKVEDRRVIPHGCGVDGLQSVESPGGDVGPLVQQRRDGFHISAISRPIQWGSAITRVFVINRRTLRDQHLKHFHIA